MKKMLPHNEFLLSLPPKNVSAAVALLNDKSQVLAVKATYKRYWSLPGGIVDAFESPRAAAIRELKEETGIEVPNVTFLSVVHMFWKDDARDQLYFLFTARMTADVETHAENDDEIADIKWLTPDELIEASGHRAHIAVATDFAGGKDVERYYEFHNLI